MPKKFGTNTKKEEAKERDAQKKKDDREHKVKKAEDEYWKENDDNVNKKLQKEREKEKKRLDELKRKQENKELVEKEMSELMQQKNKNQVKAPSRREIEDHKERTLKKLLEQNQQEKTEEVEEINVEKEFVNPNYQKLDQQTLSGAEVIDVTGVEDALIELSMTEFDKHPEKRMRAAWNAYLEKQLPLFKAENPNMKRSQMLGMIQKEFKKSPENPVYVKQLMMSKEAKDN